MTTRHPLVLVACLAVGVGLNSGRAAAQDLEPVVVPPSPAPAAPEQPVSPANRPASLTAIEFDPEPLVLSQHGIQIAVPAGWSTQRVTTEATPGREFDPEADPRRARDLRDLTRWTELAAQDISLIELAPGDSRVTIRIQTPRVGDETGPTSLDVLAQSVAQQIVDAAAARSGASVEAYAVFEKHPDLRIAGRPAYRFYIRLPRRHFETGLVLGYTLLDLPGPEFLVLEMTTPEENFVDLDSRAVYETVCATLEFLDPATINAQRRQWMLAGSAFMGGRTREQVQAAMARIDGRLERLYEPAPGGGAADERERGVRRTNCWIGQRGEIDPSKPVEAFADIEREEGYIVELTGRYLNEMEDESGRSRRISADFRARYWVSFDRQTEAWLKWMLIDTPLSRRGPVEFREVGARDGDSLTVWTRAPGEGDRVVRPVFEAGGYMSQAEFYLFADLAAGGEMPWADFGYYVWQTGAETCRFVHDTVVPEGDGLGCAIRRVVGDNAENHDIAFNGALDWTGTVIRVGVEETHIAPTTFERLRSLWDTKGIPMGALRGPAPASQPGGLPGSTPRRP
ncbi:MAG: hypothetical protein R3B68_03945 [Phycisphaerales bacterium]